MKDEEKITKIQINKNKKSISFIDGEVYIYNKASFITLNKDLSK